MSARTDTCPLSGRQYELWQPLLSMAHLIDTQRGTSLAAHLTRHAIATLKATQEDQNPEFDVLALRVLTELIRKGKAPTSQDILSRCQSRDPEVFRNVTPRRVAEVLKKYRISARRGHQGRRMYSEVTVEQMKLIERHYGMDLNTSGELPGTVRVREY